MRFICTSEKLKADLVVESHTLVEKKPFIKILGKIANKSTDLWSSISVEAKFYDKKGGLVEIISGYHTGAILAGNSDDFKIENGCTGCKANLEFERYEIAITGAYNH